MGQLESDLNQEEQKVAGSEAALEARVTGVQADLQNQINALKAGTPVDIAAHIAFLEGLDAKLAGVDPATTPAP